MPKTLWIAGLRVRHPRVEMRSARGWRFPARTRPTEPSRDADSRPCASGDKEGDNEGDKDGDNEGDKEGDKGGDKGMGLPGRTGPARQRDRARQGMETPRP
ncbi:hypothetical protein GCM10022255_054020 [Dactylosporangium darangshiense]|uniref:Uncharacterized protein n=1 Tax=Dactylosporangium darangshiense TaxID=579108 RepID=A0ABP8DE08_9ACTN